MAQPRKPARLWLDEEHKPEPEWYILDNVGGKRVKERTHCGAGSEREAASVLAAYVTARDAKADAAALKGKKARKTKREPSEVTIGELAAWALERRGPLMARPLEYAARWDVVLDYSDDGEQVVGEIDSDWCDDFVSHAGTASYGRRCLEDLRAAANLWVDNLWLSYVPKFKLPTKAPSRPDHLSEEEVRALIFTARNERDIQSKLHGSKKEGAPPRWLQDVVSTRYRWRHLVPYIAVSVLTCTRASRVYEASYVFEEGRPWLDLDNGLYHRLAAGETERKNKRAPTVPLSDDLVRWLRWRTRPRTRRGKLIPGDTYLVQYAGRPVDCRKSFEACVERARQRFPHLFKRSNGQPKEIVRHTLRHTGVTLLSQWGVPAGDICEYAGMSPEVYDRVYKHTDPERMDRVMAALGGRKGRRASAK